MLKGLGDLSKMGGMLKQAMEVKKNIEAVKEQLAEERVTGNAGGGMVTVEMNGNMEVLSVKIDPEVVDRDEVEVLETLVQAALNQTVTNVQERVRQKMAEATGGLDIPGLTE